MSSWKNKTQKRRCMSAVKKAKRTCVRAKMTKGQRKSCGSAINKVMRLC